MPEQVTNRVKRRMISLYDADEAAILQIGKDNGISSFSATLRWLVNDWKRMKLQQNIIISESRTQYSTEPTS